MTTVHETVGNVHYRRLPEMSSDTPDTRPERSLDVTKRLCVPCAVVGNARIAAEFSEDFVPLCAGHVRLARLSRLERDALIGAWASEGAQVGIRLMFEGTGKSHRSAEAHPVGRAS